MRLSGRLFPPLLFLLALLSVSPYASGAELKRLSDGVYAFIGEEGATNSGFVVTEKGVVVIDTQGPRGLAMELRRKIKEVTELPVIYAINTHYHGDHTFGNQFFREGYGIIGHEKTRETLIEEDAP